MDDFYVVQALDYCFVYGVIVSQSSYGFASLQLPTDRGTNPNGRKQIRHELIVHWIQIIGLSFDLPMLTNLMIAILVNGLQWFELHQNVQALESIEQQLEPHQDMREIETTETSSH